jgi:hypothetical protein
MGTVSSFSQVKLYTVIYYAHGAWDLHQRGGQIEHIVVSLCGIYQLNMASQILLTRDMKFLDLIQAWNVSTDVRDWKGRSA